MLVIRREMALEADLRTLASTTLRTARSYVSVFCSESDSNQINQSNMNGEPTVQALTPLTKAILETRGIGQIIQFCNLAAVSIPPAALPIQEALYVLSVQANWIWYQSVVRVSSA